MTLDQAVRDYEALQQRGLKLDLTRGKPAAQQLDLSMGMLALPSTHLSAAGVDARNYGDQQGLAETRELFGPLLQVPPAQVVVGGNSSLALMHDSIVQAMLSVMPGADRRWADEDEIIFLCPVPGYDRHFALCERFGITMVAVPMDDEGPDMEVVERLVAEDTRVKGIWCVPKYSNPSGLTYSDATVARLAAMPTAADDFRIFWDNAYAVHHLSEKPDQLADVLALCAEQGNADRVFVFGSTSKVTFPGSGISFFGSSPANVAWFLANSAKQTIGPDKINQLRHVEFFGDAEGVAAHMRRHAELIGPKFETVDQILEKELTGLASWKTPAGGYFISLDVPEGCAREVVAKAKAAGIALTPAGATHPYGDDPADRTIRIAPTFPTVAELEQAIEGLAICVKLVAAQKG